MLEHGEITSSVPLTTVYTVTIQSIQQSTAKTNTETNVARSRGQGRGSGQRCFYRNTGENDAYDLSIAPLNIFENQMIPISLHNLSKGFRPNLSTIRVLSLGAKFIPRWKLKKRNNTFKYANDF